MSTSKQNTLSVEVVRRHKDEHCRFTIHKRSVGKIGVDARIQYVLKDSVTGDESYFDSREQAKAAATVALSRDSYPPGSPADFPAIAREDLAVCEAILRGETVRGVKLGDAGITKEWVEGWRDNMRAMLAKQEKTASPKPTRKPFFQSVAHPHLTMNRYGVVFAPNGHPDGCTYYGKSFEVVPLAQGKLPLRYAVEDEARAAGYTVEQRHGEDIWHKPGWNGKSSRQTTEAETLPPCLLCGNPATKKMLPNPLTGKAEFVDVCKECADDDE